MTDRLGWMQDTFSYAEGYDEQIQRYRGLKGPQRTTLFRSAGVSPAPPASHRIYW